MEQHKPNKHFFNSKVYSYWSSLIIGIVVLCYVFNIIYYAISTRNYDLKINNLHFTLVVILEIIFVLIRISAYQHLYPVNHPSQWKKIMLITGRMTVKLISIPFLSLMVKSSDYLEFYPLDFYLIHSLMVVDFFDIFINDHSEMSTEVYSPTIRKPKKLIRSSAVYNIRHYGLKLRQ